MSETKKVMLIYPPGKLYQRGEDRCQSNIGSSTATSVRACNDLGYVTSVLKKQGYDVFLKDYQTERLCLEDLLMDFRYYNPDVLFISITNATIFSDLEVVNQLKKIKDNLVIILKGALFFNPENEMLNQLKFDNVDYLIGGEAEFVMADLLDAHFENPDKIKEICGILYKKNGEWVRTDFNCWQEGLDSLPFPDRSLMNNKLYVRPDTGEPQATISTSRGCAAACTFCLTPVISGTKIRFRSPLNILEELIDCYKNHGIRNFFFKADTFTINKQWTLELCNLIINSELNGKIEWVANSRVNPIDKETLEIMKKAGCWLVAFGFESGSPETLLKTRKGATVEQNLQAARYAKEVGLKVYGFYLIGFPWESKEHLKETEKLIFEINADFIELHLALPYYGTPLYELAKSEGLIDESVLGKDYFNAPTIGTKYLMIDEIEEFRKNLLFNYHIRPGYIAGKLRYALFKPKTLMNYASFGIRLFKNLLNK